MRDIVFCGFGPLAINCLNALEEAGYKVRFILTHEDDSHSGVKHYAIEHNIKYSTSDLRKDKELLASFIKDEQRCSDEYLVSVNYRNIIPAEAFSLFYRALNLHGGPLPRYRGRTPHVWSIINGEKYTAVTCHIIESAVDAGDIITQRRVVISADDTGQTLLMKMNAHYPELLLMSLNLLEKGVKPRPQNHALATYYGKRTPDMGYINFLQTFCCIRNFVRALAPPYPGAYCFLPSGQKIIIHKIEKSALEIENQEIGRVFEHEGSLYVKCKTGLIHIVDYAIEN